MKRQIFIILFLLFAGASYAQPPHIDSMYVDEMKGELDIYGSFGSAQGKVWVDSVEPKIISWSDTFIISSIPTSGRGAAGPVIVGGRGYHSESRMLTMWGIGATSGWTRSANYYSEYAHTESIFYWRIDLDSRLRHSQNGMNYSLPFNEKYSQQYTYHLESNAPGTTPIWKDDYSSTNGLNPGKLDLNTFTLYTNIGGNDVVSKFDSNLFPAPWVVRDFNGGSFMWGNQEYFATEVKFPPSHGTLALWYKPNLILPLSGTVYSFNNITKLIWDSLPLMSGYHVQVSVDSLFQTKNIDTTISSLNISLTVLSGLTKYFWRVAGVNSEGESRWSEVWNFTTGVTAGIVKTEAAPFSFSAFPNPASDKLNIKYSLSQRQIIISLYNTLGVRVRTLTIRDNEPNEVEMPLAGLPAGSYLLELSDERIHESMPISIIR